MPVDFRKTKAIWHRIYLEIVQMSTFSRNAVILGVALGACAHSSQHMNVTPAPADSSETRSWKMITVSGPYGKFEMPVPVLQIATNFVIDSTALREVQKQLTARISSIAREEAAALVGDSVRGIVHHPTQTIKPDLLGAVEFDNDSVGLNSSALTRLQGMARIAQGVPGAIELVSTEDGTGPAVFDVAVARARRVYLALTETNSRLLGRAVQMTVRTNPVLPGAPRAVPTVEVYIRPQ